MKIFRVVMVAVAVMILLPHAAFAVQDEQPPRQQRPDRDRPPGGAWMRGGSPLTRALDADGDGTISEEEIAAAAAALRELDEDGDGSLLPNELGGRAAQRGNAARGPAFGSRRGPGAGPPAFGLRGSRGGFGRPGIGAGRFGAGRFGAGRFGVGRFLAGWFGVGRFGPGRAGSGARQRGQFGRLRAAAPGAAGLLERFDDNEDGTLAQDEVPELLWERLSQADADSDGVITSQELEEAAPQRRPLWRPRRR